MDPETAHDLAIGSLKLASSLPGLKENVLAPGPLGRKLFGLSFPNPVGLAAGFDKNGIAIPALAALGFGSVEIGTVTAVAQPGNPKPRMFRAPESEAIINRLGFNNRGAAAMAEHLQHERQSSRWPAIPVGINICMDDFQNFNPNFNITRASLSPYVAIRRCIVRIKKK